MQKCPIIFLILLMLTVPAMSFDEDNYTSDGQWNVSSSEDKFIHYKDHDQLSKRSANDYDYIDGRFFSDQEDITNDYQVHVIYILASDSKDKEYDVNGTIEKIVLRGNDHLKENTNQQQFRLDLTKDGELDVSFMRVSKTRKEINRLENGAGYFTGMAILNGFNNPRKLYSIFYQDSYQGEWGQLGDAIYHTPNGTVEINAGVVYLGADKVSDAWIPHIHELFHALGFVQLCAPGAIIDRYSSWGKNDHLKYDNDIMSESGDSFYIDKKRTDYYGHSNSDCELDLERSAYMMPTMSDFQLQPYSPSCKLTRWQPKYNHARSLDCLSKLDF